jgi:hypothetical protein
MDEPQLGSETKRIRVLVILLLAVFLAAAWFLVWPYLQHSAGGSSSNNYAGSNSGVKSNNRENTHSDAGPPSNDACAGLKTNTPANKPPDVPVDPPPAVDVTVDFRIRLPEIQGAVGWKPITSSSGGQALIVGGIVRSGLGEIQNTPIERDGFVTYSDMLTLRVTDAVLAIAVLQVLEPVDINNKIVPGFISFYAAHTVLQRSGLVPLQRIVLEQNAPTRNFTLLFDSEAKGAAFGFMLANVNEPSWLSRSEALKHEPNLWPSEVAKEFRFSLEEREYTGFNKASVRGIVGLDCTVRVTNLPAGFAVPSVLKLRKDSRVGGGLETCFLSNHAGELVENNYQNQTAVLPRNDETIAYLRTADDFLPQIKLSGPLASSPANWRRLRVKCRLPSGRAEQPAGTDVATAFFDPDKGRWFWSVSAHIDIQAYSGATVFYTVEEIGTALVVVEGLVAPQPEIEISVGPPQEPWTITATLVDAGASQLPLPIRFYFGFGNCRNYFQGAAATTSDGIWQISGIEGPLSQVAFNEDSSVSADVDVSLLEDMLKTLCKQQDGSKVSLQVIVELDNDRSSPASCNFVSRSIQLTSYFTLMVNEFGKEPATLLAFLADHKIGDSYAIAIKNLLRDDQ